MQTRSEGTNMQYGVKVLTPSHLPRLRRSVPATQPLLPPEIFGFLDPRLVRTGPGCHPLATHSSGVPFCRRVALVFTCSLLIQREAHALVSSLSRSFKVGNLCNPVQFCKDHPGASPLSPAQLLLTVSPNPPSGFDCPAPIYHPLGPPAPESYPADTTTS